MAGMMGLMTTNSFRLDLGSQEGVATFKKCSGVERENDKIEFPQRTKAGVWVMKKVPGTMKWSDITLERGLDASPALWEWCKQIEDGKFNQAKKDGSIVVMDASGEEIVRWNFRKGWPCKWTGSDFDAGANDIATEKLVITHEGLTQVTSPNRGQEMDI
jgi:phage tail-like protein